MILDKKKKEKKNASTTTCSHAWKGSGFLCHFKTILTQQKIAKMGIDSDTC